MERIGRRTGRSRRPQGEEWSVIDTDPEMPLVTPTEALATLGVTAVPTA